MISYKRDQNHFESSANILSRHFLVQCRTWKHENTVWNLFKANNKDTKNDATSVVLVPLCSTLNRYDTLFWSVHCFISEQINTSWIKMFSFLSLQFIIPNISLVQLNINKFQKQHSLWSAMMLPREQHWNWYYVPLAKIYSNCDGTVACPSLQLFIYFLLRLVLEKTHCKRT